jgi:hypothetical protein
MLIEKFLQKHQVALPKSLQKQVVTLPWLKRIAQVDRLILTSSNIFYTGEVVLHQCFTMQDQK